VTHAHLRQAGIACFRVPVYTEGPTDVRMTLDAASAQEARGTIRRALEGSGSAVHPADEFIFEPQLMSGAHTGEDGAPEEPSNLPSFWAER
jgi:hypothetical protein